MKNKLVLYIGCIFYLLLCFCSLDVPFFWDGTFFSESAVFFYEEGWNGFIPPENVDTGGFPLYSSYLAIVWKIFGKSLAVSHLAILPFVLGAVYQYHRLSGKFLGAAGQVIAMLLLVVEPAFATQSILMGYDLLMIFFFLLSLNALLERRGMLFSIALALLCISSVRGIMLGVSLLFLDIILNYRIAEKPLFRFRNYLVAPLLLVAWSVYHHAFTGWFIFSPERENTHEAVLPFSMMIRQFLFIQWKLVDLGRIIPWLALLAGAFWFYRRSRDIQFRKLLNILFVPLLVLVLFMMTLGNPAGHKYFIVVFLCLNIAVAFLLEQLRPVWMTVSAAVICLAMITGNFWMYPERFGNAWDSSLKVLPYFELREEMDRYIAESGIEAGDIGTQYPLIADRRYSHLADSSSAYTNVWSGPVESYKYFLFTNVINTDIIEQVEEVKKNWTLVKRISSGQVYMELYRNEKFLFFQF